jgi:UDP-N-acetylmuramyl pentapeptide synthase
LAPFQQSFNQYPSSFPVFDHLTQQMDQSPKGDDSYNGTPTSRMRKMRHLEEIHEEDVEVVPKVKEVTKMHALIHHTRKRWVLHQLDLMG